MSHGMGKQQCKALLLYPHINWGAGGTSVGGCLQTFTGRPTTLCCPRCSKQVYRLRAKGDYGIQHPDNPFNSPKRIAP